jgi:hypothetical protein
MATSSYKSYTKYGAKHLFIILWLIAGKATTQTELQVAYLTKRTNA